MAERVMCSSCRQKYPTLYKAGELFKIGTCGECGKVTGVVNVIKINISETLEDDMPDFLRDLVNGNYNKMNGNDNKGR